MSTDNYGFMELGHVIPISARSERDGCIEVAVRDESGKLVTFRVTAYAAQVVWYRVGQVLAPDVVDGAQVRTASLQPAQHLDTIHTAKVLIDRERQYFQLLGASLSSGVSLSFAVAEAGDLWNDLSDVLHPTSVALPAALDALRDDIAGESDDTGSVSQLLSSAKRALPTVFME